MVLVYTNFNPLDHGFRFANHFEFSFLSQFSLPLGKRIALGNIVYGLCGGMCFAALDYFHTRKPIPTYASADEMNLKLFRYLWERQMDSLAMAELTKLAKWMFYTNRTVARLTANEEVPRLHEQINLGQPAVLALIRVGGVTSPTENHQVLAIAYEQDPISQQMTIHLYDPNHPGVTPSLRLNLSNPNQGIDINQSTGEPLRGFFIIPYQPRSPD